MPRFGRRRFAVLGALLCLEVGACLSPTLPLPPPEQPDVENVGQGRYRLSGELPSPGRAEAMNLSNGLISGQYTDTVRAYSFEIGAQPGDRMQFWYTAGAEASDSIFFIIESENAGDASVPEGGGGDASGSDAGATDAADGGG